MCERVPRGWVSFGLDRFGMRCLLVPTTFNNASRAPQIAFATGLCSEQWLGSNHHRMEPSRPAEYHPADAGVRDFAFTMVHDLRLGERAKAIGARVWQKAKAGERKKAWMMIDSRA